MTAFMERLHDGDCSVMTGQVQRLIRDKGFGFIRVGGGPLAVEFFFHKSSCPDFDSLQEGDQVEFEEEASQKGPRATHVHRL